MVNLITEHMGVWTAAQTQKANGDRGRGKNSNGQSPHGIKKLRELILELAVRGKLVPQDPNDEPANVLLERIAQEKAWLFKKSKHKKQKTLPEISEAEKPLEMPNGWEWVRLGEIGIWAIGSGFPKREQGFEGLEILFSKVSDMNLEGNEKYLFTTANTISKKTASKLRIHVHPEGTVIFPKIGGAIATNKRRIIVKPTAIDNNCLGITPMSGFDTAYLYLYLSSLDLTEYQAGTSVPALSQGTLELISLGLPPLAEQHRIVAKVDELMALCDRLEQQQTNSDATQQTLVETLLSTLTSAAGQGEFAEAWQRIANHLGTLFTTEHSIDQLKQTILQLAVMGKLVPQDTIDLPAPESGKFFVYALECDDKSIYIGQTDNIIERWKEHATGIGAAWTKKHPPLRLVHWEEYNSRKEAIKREKELKTGFGRKWIKRELAAGRTRRAGEPASVLLEKIAEEKSRLIEEGKIKKQKPLPEITEEEKPFDLPQGWELVRFLEVAQEVSTGPFGTMIHKRDYVDSGIPLINPSHMIDCSIVEETSVAVSSRKSKELSSYKLTKGDIVLARRGEMGRCALVTEREDGWLCGTGSFRLKFHIDIYLPFILLLFKTEYVRSYLSGKSVGTTMTNLNHGILNMLPILLPPSAEQHRIVAKVDELMAICDSLKARLNAAQKTQIQLADAIVEQAVA